MITECAGTDTGSPGLTRERQRLARDRERHHAAALEGHDLEPGGVVAEADVARLQRLLAGEQVDGLDVDRLVRSRA